jgi:hypothetical protein
VGAYGERYRYAILWWLEAGKPVIGEVMPAPHPLMLPSARGADAELAARLHGQAPSPGAQFDPIAAAIWREELPRTGLPFVVRCLATWWRVRDRAEPSTPGAAAVITAAVARAAGIRRTRAEAAAMYWTDPDQLEAVERALKAELRLDRKRGW